MKKNIFIITCLLLIQLVIAQSPGGVSGMAAWYKSDVGLTATTWADQSPNGYNLTRTSAPASTNFINFNSVASFAGVTANQFNNTAAKVNWPVGNATATTYYYVAKNDVVLANRAVLGIGASDDATGFHSGQQATTGTIATRGTVTFANNTGSAMVVSPPNWDINQQNQGLNLVRTGFNGGGTTGRNYISAQGSVEVTNSTNVSPSYANNAAFRIGSSGANSVFWNGDIAEVVVYSGKHNATDFNKIESYLALKWGITKQGNYVASDGAIFYNNATYNNNIAGIGRDNASGLNQKQSQSQNSGNQVIFGLGSVATTNAANANTFTVDKQFLLWGDNGASGPIAFSDTADATIFSRLARTWFVDNTNSYSQNTQLLIPVALTTGGSSPKLVMNTSSAFASGTNTYIPLSATTTINSVSYYVVNLTAAQVATDFYFSVVTNQKAPGGVISAVWYKTNDNTVFSNAGTTLATNNQTVQQWNDSNGTGANIANATAAQRPLYSNSTTLQNFHPTVTFNGAYQFLSYTPVAGQEVIDRSKGTLYAAGYMNSAGAQSGFVGFDATMDYPGFHFYSSTNRLLFFPNDFTPIGTNAVIRFKPFIAGAGWQNNSGTNGTSNSVRMRLDGFEDVWINGINNTSTGNGQREFRIGSDTNYGYLDGKLNEIIVFPNKLTIDEMTRVDSYLAIKFGMTLNQQQSRNYTNSSNTIVWDALANAQYNKNITGIGRDDFSTLNQLQSKSTNGSDNILMSVTANASETHALQTSLASFDNDKQFLIFGDNQKSGLTTLTNPTYPDLSHRFNRVWKAQTSNYNLTGNDNVVFSIPDAMLTAYRNSGKGLYLVMSSTADFSSNNYFIPITTSTYSVGGQVYASVSYNVSSSAFSGFQSSGSFYFTLAGTPVGPGGVLAIYWMRSDKGITTSGSNVNKWVDQTYGKDATQVGTNANLPAYVNVTNATQAANFNFNPYVDFTANTQALGNLNTQLFSDDVSAVNSFTVTKDNSYSGRFFGVDYDLIASSQGGFVFDWQTFNDATFVSRGATSNSGFASAITYSPALSTTLSNISHYSLTASTFQHRLNGSTIGNNVTGLSTYFGKGGYVYGNNNLALGGNEDGVSAQIAEHLIFDVALTTLQRRQVESYLAIKYGTTISDLTSDASYRDASGNATFTTDATYKYDIFGIAKEAIAGIDQRISKSINNDAGNATNIITVSTDTNFVNENTTHTNGLSDGQYLIFASNNGAVAFSGGSAITATDGTVFSATEVLATRWKAQDKGGVGCVNMRFNNAAFTAVSGSTKYYMIVADDAAFTQNVTYKEVTRDASSNIDVTVNFGDNTNGSATTGNYFTIARKNLGITPANLATVYTGVNTIGTSPNWKPTQPNTYLEINSNEKGVIVTRVADVTAATIASPIEGMMVFDLSDNKFKVYTGTSWRTLGLSEGVSATFCN